MAAEGEITWSVEPAASASGARPNFDYAVDPGTQINDSVVIANRGTTPADFRIYATDAVNEFETGAFGLLSADKAPTDSGAWITTDKDSITLAPGTEATVPFTMLVPSDAAPGDHVSGIVASVLTKATQDGAAVTLEQRVGARIYLTVSGAQEATVELAGLSSTFTPSINPFAPGDVDVVYTVSNTGNMRLDVAQKLTVTGPFGISLGSIKPEAMNDLLPRQTVQVKAHVPAIVALVLAWSSVDLTPAEVGTVATPDASAVAPSASPAPAGAAAVPEPDALKYVSASASVMSLAISWSLLALVVVLIAAVLLVIRYVSGTRERLYLAIDEAAANAREEALASRDDLVSR